MWRPVQILTTVTFSTKLTRIFDKQRGAEERPFRRKTDMNGCWRHASQIQRHSSCCAEASPTTLYAFAVMDKSAGAVEHPRTVAFVDLCKGPRRGARARAKGLKKKKEGCLVCPGRKALESAEPASETAMRNGKRLAAHHVITTERFEKSIMQAVGGLKSRKKVRQVLRHV